MKIVDIDLNNPIEEIKNLKLCLGFFDGLHLGHKKIIDQALQTGGNVGMMTFDLSPHIFLKKKDIYSSLTSLADKYDLLDSWGVKYLLILHTNKELLDLTRIEFIELILEKLNPEEIFCGVDYRFGKNEEGDINFLKLYFNVNALDLLRIDDVKVSSTRIIEEIKDGNVHFASKLLGRPYSLHGLVVEGNKLGQTIGFPTANLDLDFPYVLPKIGVYIGYAYFILRKRKAIISISTHPTIKELNKPLIEVHLIDFCEDIYGKSLEIEFVDYIRNIKKFDSLEDLKEQLIIDRDYAIKVLP